MKGLGAFLLILGIGSFILPFFGLQFQLLNLFGDYQLIASIAAIVIGVVLIVLDLVKNKGQQ